VIVAILQAANSALGQYYPESQARDDKTSMPNLIHTHAEAWDDRNKQSPTFPIQSLEDNLKLDIIERLFTQSSLDQLTSMLQTIELKRP